MPQPQLPKCPVTYFGKGENWNLTQATLEEAKWFNDEFDKWVTDHPEDPTGELALESYKLEIAGHTPEPTPKQYSNGEVSQAEQTRHEVEDLGWSELRLTLPQEDIERLKNYSRKMRRRPRDVIQQLIKNLQF